MHLALIQQASKEELQDIIQAVIRRHKELYPDWDLMFFTLHDIDPEQYAQDLDALIDSLRRLQQRKKG